MMQMFIMKLKQWICNSSEIISSSSLTFVTRVFGAAIVFLSNAYLARLLGVEDVGVFFLGVTLLMAAGIFARAGMETVVLQTCGVAWDAGDVDKIRSVYWLTTSIVVFFGLILTTLIYLFSFEIANGVFSEGKMFYVLEYMAIAIIPFSLIWLHSGVLKAVRRPALANFVEAGGVALLTIIIVFLVNRYDSLDVEGAARSYLIANIGVLILAVVNVQSVISKKSAVSNEIKHESVRELVVRGNSIMWISALSFITVWGATFVLGLFGTAEDVAYYTVSLRTATLISFILIVVNSITAPKYAALFKKGKLDEIESLAITTAVLMAVFSFPLLVILFFWSDSVLVLFGEGFREAGLVLSILAVGQFINVYTGSVGYILLMSGNEKVMRDVVFTVTLVGFPITVVLVINYRSEGAAIASALSIAIQNLLATWFVFRKLGIRALPGWLFVSRAVSR